MDFSCGFFRLYCDDCSSISVLGKVNEGEVRSKTGKNDTYSCYALLQIETH
ncbi:hypothetical protein Xmau_00707 [Xenorhabdus mauleonii]|uniref:Uncharacterized protein n=1 Tax=Xenorhabdus mauleonii TaxID=351675 RepID=A0A1I3JRP8_9GAMM|nr:hypothetical protein Xmau_00707 [Xenorhabdus mauleonii]SFI62931.1 hypothetical protein SAMN05421680_102300 [Xenorhabdus mauleonii]